MNRIAFVLCCLLCSTVLGQTTTKEYAERIEKIIKEAHEVAVTDQEKADLRILEWNLKEFKKFAAKKDFKSAAYVKKRMQASLPRSTSVATDAPRRKAEWERAERERQHREIVRQNERNHQELMNQLRIQQQQDIINQLRNRR